MESGPTGEGLSSREALDGGLQEFDGGDGLSPLSSQYSSCGESEFDRYCSANSVMGTPSVCSSMGFFHDSLDGDFRSLKSLEGFSLGGGRVPRAVEEKSQLVALGRERDFGSFLSDEGEGLSHGGEFGGDAGCSSWGNGVVPMLGGKDEVKGMKVFDNDVGKKENLAVLLRNVENVLLQGAVAARSAAENLLEYSHADEMEDERCQEVDETSSRCEHSDGEDSMFNGGSDDGSPSNAYYVRNVSNEIDEGAGSGNLVLMNPSVAFGSKDWDDFELDGTEKNEGLQLPDDLFRRQQPNDENETHPPKRSTSTESSQWHEEEEDDDLLRADDSCEVHESSSTDNLHSLKIMEEGAVEDIKGTVGVYSSAPKDESDEYLESCSMSNIFENQCSPIHVQVEASSMLSENNKENQDEFSDKASGLGDCSVLRQRLDHLPDLGVREGSHPAVDDRKDFRFDIYDGGKLDLPMEGVPKSASSWIESDKGRNRDNLHLPRDNFTTSKAEDFEMDAFFEEVVHDMEDILLDSIDSSAMRLKQRCTALHSDQSSPIGDGLSTASTSSLDDGFSLNHHSFKIDGIELVGAKQRQGDVSFSERLVGVREYTVYVIRVWSGKYKWEVERRYRDFYTLYRRLKTFFAAQEWTLPPPWSYVERESRKIFGNGSPDVVAERSTLIQECLSSILQSRYFSSPPSALIWFLSPPEGIFSSSQPGAVVRQLNVGADTERVSTLGQTISLVVDLRSQKSVKELLEKQHYTCAGCHKHFDNGKTRMLEIAQSLGWGKPRFCEYTGQLFCSSCHKNETAVLPATVLHHWDFTPYPVSQMAKSYLDSIIDKPMLCVSAANPFLFSKVPTLLHIVGVRRKIGAMLPHIRCSFRKSVYRRLGYRKYLLESNDFFALRDLIDLSKGAFAALPAILEAVLKKIQEHITELCLECCDNGVPCGARQACDNPSSLIFPFQEEEEIRRCKSCSSVFHKDCFSKLAECPCGVVLKEVDANKSLTNLRRGNSGSAIGSLLAKNSDGKSPVEYISRLFSMSSLGKTKSQKDGDNVVLMGSLPSTSL